MKNIFVGNLDHSVTEEELKEAFDAFGSVTKAAVIKDKFTGQSRGFGFVEMQSDEEAQAAIDGLNGTDLKGRSINVNEARPREDRPRRPMGGGGGSRGGFGGGGGGGRGGFGNSGGGRGRF